MRIHELINEVKEIELDGPSRKLASRLRYHTPHDMAQEPYVKSVKPVGDIRGNPVVEAQGRYGGWRTYMVINQATGRSMINVSAKENRHGVLSDLGLAAAPGNTVSASELYHFLITQLNKTLVAEQQTEASQRVWHRLEQMRDITIHGWLNGKPVNIGTQDPQAYGRDSYDLSPEQRDAVGMRLVATKCM